MTCLIAHMPSHRLPSARTAAAPALACVTMMWSSAGSFAGRETSLMLATGITAGIRPPSLDPNQLLSPCRTCTLTVPMVRAFNVTFHLGARG